MNKCYRIYMEDCGPESHRFVMQWWQYQPHALFFGNGSWMGRLNESMILEMVLLEYGNGINMNKMIENFSKEFCAKYRQEAVFVTEHEVKAYNV